MNSVKQFVVRENGDNEFYSHQEAQDFVASKAAYFRSKGWDGLAENLEVQERDCGYVTESGYSDAYPYEIVRVVSDKCIEIRALNAELLNGDELKFHVGGFSSHCSNQRAQEYRYSSNPDAGLLKVRLNKHGNWVHKGRRFSLAEKPYKFHDYNF